MGRGGCELAEAGANCIRGIIGCACCMICIGPILLIVGITLLSVDNNYDNYVNGYNGAISNFENHYKPLILSSSGTVYGYTMMPLSSGSASPLSPQFSATLPSSSTEGVTQSGLSYPLKSQNNVDLSSARSGSITFNPPSSGTGSTFASNTVNFTVAQAASSTHQDSIYCSDSDIDRRRSCDDVCKKEHSCGYYTGSSSSYCRYSSSCSGYCRWSSYDSASCTQFTINNQTGELSRPSIGFSSCIYPFSGNKQPTSCNAPSGNQVPVLYMNSADPFIRIQQITGDSSFSFGLTKEQQRNLGLALIAIGATITGLVVCVAVAIYKAVFKSEKSATTVYAAFGRTYTPNGASPQNTQYNPQTQYGQQPAAGNYYDHNHMQQQQQQQPPQMQQYQQQVPPPPQGYYQNQPNQMQQYQQQPPPNPGYSAGPPPQPMMMQQQQPPMMQQQQQYNPGYGAPPGY